MTSSSSSLRWRSEGVSRALMVSHSLSAALCYRPDHISLFYLVIHLSKEMYLLFIETKVVGAK